MKINSESHEQRLAEYESLATENNLLPVKVNSFFKKKVEAECAHLNNCEGPLYRIVYPTAEKVSEKQDFETNDFVDDRENMPDDSQSSFIHKYKDRILFLPVAHCASNCIYCFRQDVLSEKNQKVEKKITLEEQLNILIEYITDKPEIEEVILSGGDPMMLRASDLKNIFSTIRSRTHIKYFRLHTKTIVFAPSVISSEKINILKDYNCKLVFHITHPYEVCDEVKNKIAELNASGLRLFNQFPILRKINDHHVVLIKLLKELDEMNVRTLSIFFPDPVQYSSAYRINLKRLFSIIDLFHWNSPSWINSTRFCQDSVFGKVRREDLHEYIPEKGYALFKREGQLIKVPDHPEKDDDPGVLETLLWKDHL